MGGTDDPSNLKEKFSKRMQLWWDEKRKVGT